MLYTTNLFRPGLKILFEGHPYNIVENEFVKPGKGQAFNRVKMKNLVTGRLLEKNFKSGESVPAANVDERSFQYLYSDGSAYHFMDTLNFEQISVPKSKIGDVKNWLLGKEHCNLTIWNERVIEVLPPTFVHLKVTETDPGVKGDTAGSGGKPATVETGATVKVPLFIQIGDWIRIDTRTGEYVSRISEK